MKWKGLFILSLSILIGGCSADFSGSVDGYTVKAINCAHLQSCDSLELRDENGQLIDAEVISTTQRWDEGDLDEADIVICAKDRSICIKGSQCS